MKEFDNYTSKFDMNNRITKLKYNHSYRVSKLSNMLAKELNLSNEDRSLATLIGLIHDIGRFEQVKKFNTLSDINTMDHGDFGAYLLFEMGLIKLFSTDDKAYDIIKTCVSKHNKFSIDREYNEREKSHLKLIRDADKLDIFNIWANLDELELKSDGKISEGVSDEFYNHSMIHNEFKKTNADSILGTIAYIYDINYDSSFKYIDEQNFINKFYQRLENKEQFKEYFEYADRYVKSKIRENNNFIGKIKILKNK